MFYEIIKSTKGTSFEGCDFVLRLPETRRGTNIKILQLTDMQIIDSTQMRSTDRLRPDEIEAWLPDRAVVVQAHPFRDNMTVVSPDLLFGVEAHNGRTSPFRNKMARDYAEHYGKVMTSGSDFHKMKDLAKGGIATPRTVTCSAELVELLKSGDYSLIVEQE